MTRVPDTINKNQVVYKSEIFALTRRYTYSDIFDIFKNLLIL